MLLPTHVGLALLVGRRCDGIDLRGHTSLHLVQFIVYYLPTLVL